MTSPAQLCLLPAPEASLLLDDWIGSGGATPAPALRALAAALGRLDIGAARSLSLASTLATGEATQEGSLEGALARWRNECAIEETDRALRQGCGRLALVFGALHMRDLRSKLDARFGIVEIGKTRWRTAWTIESPAGAIAELVAPGLALLLLLVVDATDWIGLVGTVATALAESFEPPADLVVGVAGVGAAGLYAARHAAIYLALQRWAFEWDARWWTVEGEDAAERFNK